MVSAFDNLCMNGNYKGDTLKDLPFLCSQSSLPLVRGKKRPVPSSMEPTRRTWSSMAASSAVGTLTRPPHGATSALILLPAPILSLR